MITPQPPRELPSWLQIHQDVRAALRDNEPVVALESTVLTHGLPRPQNYEIARAMEETIRAGNAIPAITAVLEGSVHLGLSDQQLVDLYLHFVDLSR